MPQNLTVTNAINRAAKLEKLRAARWRGRTDLFWLAREILGYRDIDDEVHGPIRDIVQAFPLPPEEDQRKLDVLTPVGWNYVEPWLPAQHLGGGRRRLILDPRGFFKSTLNVICHSIQWLLNYPDITILIVHGVQDIADDMISEIRGHFLKNRVLRDIYPDYCVDSGVATRYTLPNRRKIRKEPSVGIGSIGSVRAGSHYDVIKFTDIVNEQNTLNRDQIAKVNQAFMMYRNILVSPSCWIDVEGTTYDFADTYQDIIEREQKLTPAERQWRIHIRGAWKKDTGGAPYTFLPEERELRDLVDANGHKISWFPKKFPYEELERMRRDNEITFACTPGWAPILMDDWSEKSIANVQVGESVIGWQRPPKGRGRRAFLRPSKVLDKGCVFAQVFRYTMASGASIHCTADHLWWNGRTPSAKDDHSEWQTAKVGRSLKRVVDPLPTLSSDQVADFHWLCGMLDGEGAIKHAGCVITQSLNNRSVCARLEDCFRNLGIDFNTWVRDRSADGLEDTHYYSLSADRQFWRHLLLRGRMGKRDQVAAKLWRHATGIGTFDKIVSREVLGYETVYWLKTETGNYVSQGYASRNSQQLNNPVDTGDAKPFPITKLRTKAHEEMRKVPMAYYTTTVDLAEVDNAGADYSVLLTCGWDGYGRCYVVDARHGRFMPDDVIRQLFDVYDRWKPRQIKVEETGYVRGLKTSIGRHQDLTGKYLPLLYIPRDNERSKIERILLTLQPWYHRGDIIFDDSLPCFEQFRQELTRFPKGKNDDLIDALSDQFQEKQWSGREAARPTDEKQFDTYLADSMEKAFEFKLAKPSDNPGPEPTQQSFWDTTGGL